MKRPSRSILILIAVLAVAAIAGAWRFMLGPVVPAVAVEKGELAQTVVSTGRVITPSRVEIGTVMLGTILTREADEGETVRAGQVLVRLKDEEQRADFSQG